MHKHRSAFVIATMLAALAFQFMLCACSAPVIACFTDKNNTPERCYELFVTCMANEQYSEAEQYIINYDTLGFSERTDDPFSSIIFDTLAESRSGRVLERISDQGHKVTLNVEYTTFDFRLIEPALSEATSTLVYETQFAGTEVSSNDQYDQAMLYSLQQLLLQPQNYYRTATFTLDFELYEGEWKIISTDEFYSALIGYSL